MQIVKTFAYTVSLQEGLGHEHYVAGFTHKHDARAYMHERCEAKRNVTGRVWEEATGYLTFVHYANLVRAEDVEAVQS